MNLSAQARLGGSISKHGTISHLVLNSLRLCVERAPCIQRSICKHAPPLGARRSRRVNIRRIADVVICIVFLLGTGCELFDALSSKLDRLKKA
jgi:hypothetical protein